MRATCNKPRRGGEAEVQGRKNSKSEEEEREREEDSPRGLPVRSALQRGAPDDWLDLISISRNSMITKDRKSVRRRARVIFISNWIHGGSEGLS